MPAIAGDDVRFSRGTTITLEPSKGFDLVLRRNAVRARNPQFCTISSIARFAMTMGHV
jgi:hypothetical protein